MFRQNYNIFRFSIYAVTFQKSLILFFELFLIPAAYGKRTPVSAYISYFLKPLVLSHSIHEPWIESVKLVVKLFWGVSRRACEKVPILEKRRMQMYEVCLLRVFPGDLM